SLLWTGAIRDSQKTGSAVYMQNQEFRGRLKWKTFPERLTDAGINWGVYQNEVNAAGMDPSVSGWLGNVGNILEHFNIFNVHLTNASNKKLEDDIATATASLAKLNAETATIDSTMKDDHIAAIQQQQEAIEALQAQLEHGGAFTNLSPMLQELHMRAFVTNAGDPDYHSIESIKFKGDGKELSMTVPKGDVFYQFRKDVKENTLPTVSWLVPSGKFSDHPSQPWYGAWWVSEVVDILTADPEVWKKTILIYTYDENDGYFDHGQSYVAPDPNNSATGRVSKGITDAALEYTYSHDETAQEVSAKSARSGPIGLGFRVPMIVASPWSRGGYVNSELADQTSTIKFLETFLNKKYKKNIYHSELSGFRRAICGDLTSCFRPADEEPAKLTFLNRDKFVESIQRAKYKEVPSNYKKLSQQEVATYDAGTHPAMSHQEPGTRPACALPYELYCEGGLTNDGKHFTVVMKAGTAVHGARSAGAPFNVYVRNTAQSIGVIERGPKNNNMIVASYSVKAGDTMMETFPVGLFAGKKYEIEVHAPNGFYRSFSGDDKPSPLTVRCVYDHTGMRL
ncbi:MAG: alkaline phosphatase family protein, partial [Bryocella sp.]